MFTSKIVISFVVIEKYKIHIRYMAWGLHQKHDFSYIENCCSYILIKMYERDRDVTVTSKKD